MNKVLQINLGGYPFTIDEDAYRQLDNYIKAIRRHFAGTDGYEEITTDIEARLAELFQERLDDRPIVSMKDVEEVIARMGKPEEFGAEALEDEGVGARAKTTFDTQYKTGKRLFRNPDDEVIAGVCSGIAAYFGISDPVWVRLAFVLIALSGGFGVPVYIILWAILPKAETASDRLAMRGEPINVSNIGRIIQEEFENISKKVSEFSEELGAKTGNDGDGIGSDTDVKQLIHKVIDGLGIAIRNLINVLAKIWKPLLFIIALILILMVLAGWIAAVFGAFVSPPLVEHFFPGESTYAFLGVFSLMLVVGLPLLSIALTLFRWVFNTRVNRFWRTGLGVLWVANLVFVFFLISAGVAQFAEGATTQYKATLDEIETDTLNLSIMDNWEERRPVYDWADHDFVLPPVETRVRLRKAEGEDFYIVQETHARGRNYQEASYLADAVGQPFELMDNNIKVKNWVPIPEGGKWRAQHVVLTVYVPEGKYVKTDLRRWGSLRFDARYEDGDARLWRFKDNLWQMKADGLSCLDCPAEEEMEEGLTFSE